MGRYVRLMEVFISRHFNGISMRSAPWKRDPSSLIYLCLDIKRFKGYSSFIVTATRYATQCHFPLTDRPWWLFCFQLPCTYYRMPAQLPATGETIEELEPCQVPESYCNTYLDYPTFIFDDDGKLVDENRWHNGKGVLDDNNNNTSSLWWIQMVK